jgi:hypothetical protein
MRFLKSGQGNIILKLKTNSYEMFYKYSEESRVYIDIVRTCTFTTSGHVHLPRRDMYIYRVGTCTSTTSGPRYASRRVRDTHHVGSAIRTASGPRYALRRVSDTHRDRSAIRIASGQRYAPRHTCVMCSAYYILIMNYKLLCIFSMFRKLLVFNS